MLPSIRPPPRRLLYLPIRRRDEIAPLCPLLRKYRTLAGPLQKKFQV